MKIQSRCPVDVEKTFSQSMDFAGKSMVGKVKFGSFCGKAALLAMLGLIVTPALGQTSGMLSFQGFIKDGVGDPVNGNVNLQFRIYDAEVGGNLVDMDGDGTVENVVGEDVKESLAVSVTDGVLSTKFGPVKPVSFDGTPRWLDVLVDGVPLSRLEMVTAPATSEQMNAPGSGVPCIRIVDDPNGPNVIAGLVTNSIEAGVYGATISGGGGPGGWENKVTDDFGTVGGGAFNYAGSDDSITSNGTYATVGGGYKNKAAGSRATIAGGSRNTVSGAYSTIGGGDLNMVSHTEGTVAGGYGNTVSGQGGAVGGGYGNLASGSYSTVPGGSENTALGDYSFAAGRRAIANHQGSFVWGDSTIADFASTANDQFLIRANGGVGIGTNAPGAQLDTFTNGKTFAIRAENNKAGGSNYGVYGRAIGNGGTQYGVYGTAAFDNATSTSDAVGVRGYADANNSTGSMADAYGGDFTAFADDFAYGVYAYAKTDTDTAYGIYAHASTSNPTGTKTYGIYAKTSGSAPTRYAGYFVGNVHVTGNLSASGTKPFKIDHPLDPENKFLYHYALESPEVLNVYRGTVVLDAAGAGQVVLPSYFESINRDFSYQLTAVGASMPQLHIAKEIVGNTFQIAGGQAGNKVSWMVTGVRNDQRMKKFGAPVEVLKLASDRGKYLDTEALGKPVEMGIHYSKEMAEQDALRQKEQNEQPTADVSANLTQDVGVQANAPTTVNGETENLQPQAGGPGSRPVRADREWMNTRPLQPREQRRIDLLERHRMFPRESSELPMTDGEEE